MTKMVRPADNADDDYDAEEEEYSETLKQLLQNEKINILGLPKILVYNSPYKIINRRNEILIQIAFETQ